VRRTKEWWARLDEHERAALVSLERDASKYAHGSPYYPDDCVECTCCGNPSLGNTCPTCRGTIDELIAKANGGAGAEAGEKEEER
jgi:hypothetical protein